MVPRLFSKIVAFFKQRASRLRTWRSSTGAKSNANDEKYNKKGGTHVRASSEQTQSADKLTATSTTTTLSIALVNNTSSSTVYVYIIGLAISEENQWFLLQSDGITGYYPDSPSSTGAALQADVAIQLGSPGTTRIVTIPQLAGGRVYVSLDSQLTFLLNPGPALVEPSVTNPSDPNINIMWDFCEFTFNGALYANISYVDFVSMPIALSLKNAAGSVQTVTGMATSGLDTICSNLVAQTAADGVQGWSNLIVTNDGSNLRALSPNSRLALAPNEFPSYWTSYVNQMWSKYTNSALTIKSYDDSINTTGEVMPSSSNQLLFNNVGFSQPNTADVFSCNTGPFATGSDQIRDTIIPQLAAAFNRSTLLESTTTPTDATRFYQSSVTNHYARIVHAAQIDGKGYAFAYDDVAPADGVDQSGYITDSDPQLWTITFGGTS